MTALPNIIPGAEPMFMRRGPIGCLILHGFMASPNEVAWLGHYLAQQGHTVYVPRLTGHGVDPTHMTRMRWQDWYAHALDGYHILRQQCEKVVVIGHSMGGLLGLILAANHLIDALAVAASPVVSPSSQLPFAHFISYIMPYTYHPSEDDLNQRIVEEQAARGEPVFGRVHYPKWSTRAVAEFYYLMKATREHLQEVTCPLLLLYAQADQTAPASNLELIAAKVNSPRIEKCVLQKGQHIMFMDEGREEAFARVGAFIKNNLL